MADTDEHARGGQALISQINTDSISENQSHLRHQRSIDFVLNLDKSIQNHYISTRQNRVLIKVTKLIKNQQFRGKKHG